MATYDQMKTILKSQIGVTESPPNSNFTRYGAELDAALGPEKLSNGGTSSRQGQAWCGTLLNWAAFKIGLKLPVNPFYVPGGLQQAKNNGTFIKSPVPGALVVYDWDGGTADHIGWVETILPDGRPVTIEGNTSPIGFQSDGGRVCRFSLDKGDALPRPASTILGYIKVQYDYNSGGTMSGDMSLIAVPGSSAFFAGVVWDVVGPKNEPHKVIRQMEWINDYADYLFCQDNYPLFTLESIDTCLNITLLNELPVGDSAHPDWTNKKYFKRVMGFATGGSIGAAGKDGKDGKDGINGVAGKDGATVAQVADEIQRRIANG